MLHFCVPAVTICATMRALSPAPVFCSRIHVNSPWGAAMADSDDDYDARKVSFICDEEDEARTLLCLPNACGRISGMPTEPSEHHRERLVLPYESMCPGAHGFHSCMHTHTEQVEPNRLWECETRQDNRGGGTSGQTACARTNQIAPCPQTHACP